VDVTESNIIVALAKVQAAIGGIGKSKPKDAQLSYAYRGIDAISAAAQPLFGEHGIVIVPTVATITSIQDVTINGKPWTDTFVSVEWTVYGPGGIDDCITSVTQGVGRDNSDKGISKGMTQAFKNLLLRLLCIGDPQDDADRPEHQNNFTDAPAAPDAADVLFSRVKATKGTPMETTLRNVAAESGGLALSARAFRDDQAWAALVSAHLDVS
jgi:hypothetical protein